MHKSNFFQFLGKLRTAVERKRLCAVSNRRILAMHGAISNQSGKKLPKWLVIDESLKGPLSFPANRFAAISNIEQHYVRCAMHVHVLRSWHKCYEHL